MVLPPFAHYFWHRDWQNTITILAGLLDDATALLWRIQAESDDVFHQMANLTVRCLGRARAVAPKVAEQIGDAVGQVWRQVLMDGRPLDTRALQALASMRDRKWVARVYAWIDVILKDKDWRVRRAAAEALGQHATPEAMAALCTALRKWVAQVYAWINFRLKDKYWRVREAAAQALGQHRSPEAVAALCTALQQDPDERVRVAAARALGRTQDIHAVSHLLAGVRHETDSTLRRPYWKALWRLSQNAKIRIDSDGQWHPLPPVEPAFQK